MKTATIEVAGMLSALSALGVEKQLARLPGVEKAEVNYAAGSATVAYDETLTGLKAIKSRVRECGYHCTGQVLPKHVCEPDDPPGEALTVAPPADSHRPHAGHAPHQAHEAAAMPGEQAAASGKGETMAHEMGHGAGMDMQAMVRDMRNRFWIALIFTVPIFVYSPMGGMFTPPAPPFGLRLDRWLFLLATAAVVYPSWPFLVAAWRALRNGVLNMAVLVVLSVGTGYVFSV